MPNVADQNAGDSHNVQDGNVRQHHLNGGETKHDVTAKSHLPCREKISATSEMTTIPMMASSATDVRRRASLAKDAATSHGFCGASGIFEFDCLGKLKLLRRKVIKRTK